MSDEFRFAPPRVDFDPGLMNQLAPGEFGIPAAGEMPFGDAARRSPFNGYTRILTPEGGILIFYRDQALGLIWTALRVFTWLVAVGTSGWFVFVYGDLQSTSGFATFALLSILITLIVRRRIKVSHTVEIRPDAMIVDGKDVFYAEDIGDNWPELEMKDNDPDQMTICGICGTRFIEFVTANRLDRNDRTPEVLEADLKAAMEQLWGRREVTFPAAP